MVVGLVLAFIGLGVLIAIFNDGDGNSTTAVEDGAPPKAECEIAMNLYNLVIETIDAVRDWNRADSLLKLEFAKVGIHLPDGASFEEAFQAFLDAMEIPEFDDELVQELVRDRAEFNLRLERTGDDLTNAIAGTEYDGATGGSGIVGIERKLVECGYDITPISP